MDEQLQQLTDAFAATFAQGGRFTSIVDARKYASEVLKVPVRSGSLEAKLVEESIESGLVRAAQAILAKADTARDGFNQIS